MIIYQLKAKIQLEGYANAGTRDETLGSYTTREKADIAKVEHDKKDNRMQIGPSWIDMSNVQ